MKSRCPDPERIALLLERRLGRAARRQILDHAADCAGCRRQLAVGALPALGPFRAGLLQVISREQMTVAAAVLVVPLALWIFGTPSDPAPAPRVPVTRSPPPVLSRPSIDCRAPEPTAEPPAERRVPSAPPAIVRPEPVDEAPAPSATSPEPAPLPESPPALRETSVAGAPAPPAEERDAAPPETFGRLAILEPFGSLALEGAAGRVPVQDASVIPVDGRLLAMGRPSGFRLADGTRMQLASGSAVSVYQNTTRRCAGLTLHQGALLVDTAQVRSVYLRRDRTAGVLEGIAGTVHLGVGAKADALSVSALGSGLVWKRAGQGALEIGAGETVTVDADRQEPARGGARSRPSLARFVSWPEQDKSLFFASFDAELSGDPPAVLQGTTKEGYVSAVVTTQRKKVIELALPASPPQGAIVVRLQLRTTAARIQCSTGSRDSRSTLQAISSRVRSESTWITLTLTLPAGDGDGRSKRNHRGSVTISVEPPAKVQVEDLVFDLDEIELLRS